MKNEKVDGKKVALRAPTRKRSRFALLTDLAAGVSSVDLQQK